MLRALAGQPRAEGSTRVDPAAVGRVLGSGRAPEVKTIRRKITALAATGRADELLAAMAARHVARLEATNPDLTAMFYVDYVLRRRARPRLPRHPQDRQRGGSRINLRCRNLRERK